MGGKTLQPEKKLSEGIRKRDGKEKVSAGKKEDLGLKKEKKKRRQIRVKSGRRTKKPQGGLESWCSRKSLA